MRKPRKTAQAPAPAPVPTPAPAPAPAPPPPADAPVTYAAPVRDADGKVIAFGQPWHEQSAGRPYSVMTAPNRVRFEVRPGDPGIAMDVEKRRDRAELSGKPLGLRTPEVFSYVMRVSDGPDPENWNVLGQFHEAGGGRSPSWAMGLTPNGTFNFTRRADDGEETLANIPAIRGALVRIVGRVVFDATDAGETALWLDGKPLYDRKGVKTIYTPHAGAPEDQGPYFKYGIYRGAQAGNLVVEYANLEFGGDELLARITHPLPI